MVRSRRKMVAPIVIGILMAMFYLGIAAFLFFTEDYFALKILAAAVTLGLTGVAIFVTRERVKEIRSGEEDDLDNY